MVQIAFCDLLHTFHNKVNKVSMKFFVIILWRILTSPFNFQDISKITIARIFISLTKVGFSRIKRTKTEKQVGLKIRGKNISFCPLSERLLKVHGGGG